MNKHFDFIQSVTELLPLDYSLALKTGEICFTMKKRKKDWPLADSVVLASARDHSAIVISGDPHFKNLPEAIFLGEKQIHAASFYFKLESHPGFLSLRATIDYTTVLLDHGKPKVFAIQSYLCPVMMATGSDVEIGSLQDWTEAVDRATLPVLVEFWAGWCGYCRLVSPIINALGKKYSETLKVVKVNIDENPEIAKRFGINSVPVVILFERGSILEKWMGITRTESFLQLLKKHNVI